MSYPVETVPVNGAIPSTVVSFALLNCGESWAPENRSIKIVVNPCAFRSTKY